MRALVCIACSLAACAPPSETPRPSRDPELIVRENARAGDASWRLVNASNEVEGYGSRITLRAGESLDVKVNVKQPRAVTWAAFRMGWYGGAGARRVADGGPIEVAPQAECPMDPITARIECAWSTAFTLTLPGDAAAGVYLIRLEAGGYDWHVPFVVTDGRVADVLMDINVTSWQAYNNWGGESLYEDASGTMPHAKAWEVSFDRPFRETQGSGRFLHWEFHMIRFLEALGYDVTYTTAFEMTSDPGQASTAKMFLSVANDEYWTVPQRRTVDAARDRGVSLAFLGADQALWRVHFRASKSGAKDRVIACYKADYDKDPDRPPDDKSTSARFRDGEDPGPENALIGVMYNGWMLVSQPLVIADDTHWIYEGTGLRAGDTLPRMVALESDGRFAHLEPEGLRVLARSPIVDADGGPKESVASWYRASSGAEVIGIGTMGWAAGLGARNFADPRVAKITRTIMDRFSGRAGAADPPNAPWLVSDNPPRVNGDWSPSVTTIAREGLAGPTGVAVASDGTVFIADGPAHVIHRVLPGGALERWAGTGRDGATDGLFDSAQFRWPAGLALARDGTLYVADADNHVVRAIRPDRSVITWAGMAARGGGFQEGARETARFDRPIALALADEATLLVADMHNCRIRRVTEAGVSTFAGTVMGFADGRVDAAMFNNPSGLAVGKRGEIYVLDTFNQAVRVIDDGVVSTLAGGEGRIGLVDGAGSEARFGMQAGMAFLDGRVYLTDVGSARVRAVRPGATAMTTEVATFAGSGRVALADGTGDNAALAAPMALAAGPDGALYLADSGNQAVRRLAAR